MQAREEGRTGAVRRPAPDGAAGRRRHRRAGRRRRRRRSRPPTSPRSSRRPRRPSPGAPPLPPRPRAPTLRPTPSVKPRSRVDFTPLFERYVAARQALGEDVSRLKYEKFEEAVKRQAEEIRQKTGSSRLVFEVQTADGRVRLVGRPAPLRGERGKDDRLVPEGAARGGAPRRSPRRSPRGRQGRLQALPRPGRSRTTPPSSTRSRGSRRPRRTPSSTTTSAASWPGTASGATPSGASRRRPTLAPKDSRPRFNAGLVQRAPRRVEAGRGRASGRP